MVATVLKSGLQRWRSRQAEMPALPSAFVKSLLPIAVLAIGITALIVMLLWRDQAGYKPVFGAREKVSAADMMAVLDAERIPYRLHPDSGQVLVPDEQLGKVRMMLAAKGVTVLDDGTIADRRGSLNVDDEGNPSQRNVLIEDGILKGYIQDSLNARLMGVAPTGNGRRESYAHIPMPRMTNTYMLGGDKDPQEIIASIKKGLYASNFGGGQVDITSGKFVFSASEAYWVENGKIQYPVKGATIVGSGPESLKKVTMIGNDMRLDSGVGTCGKEGQSVPVGVGMPTLRIDGLTVGGTA